MDQIKNGEFQIDGVEEKYGRGEKYPQVYVDEKNYLEGRIDRIDRFKNYVRIIDYKTGAKEIRIANVLNGFELQLFVYMLSIKEKKSENLSPIASFYLPLKDEVKKLDKAYDRKKSDIFKISRGNANIFSLEEEEILEKFIKKLISKYIVEIKNGNIKLNPLRINQNTYECTHCPYRSICKFDYSKDQDKFKDVDNKISINDIKKELSDE